MCADRTWRNLGKQLDTLPPLLRGCCALPKFTLPPSPRGPMRTILPAWTTPPPEKPELQRQVQEEEIQGGDHPLCLTYMGFRLHHAQWGEGAPWSVQTSVRMRSQTHLLSCNSSFWASGSPVACN